MRPASVDAPEVVVAHGESVGWHRAPIFAVGSIGAVAIVAAGLLLSRPDVVALALPVALWCAFVLSRPAPTRIDVELSASSSAEPARVAGAIGVDAEADWVQLSVDQGGVRRGDVDAAPGTDVVRARSRLQHSGPSELLAATARGVSGDGAWVTDAVGPVRLGWNAAPRPIGLDELPVSARLRGLHGIHRGIRQGQGGEFRDIHAFAPGDELRRVDWRATARLARRPGDLLVRRTDSLSEASVVIAIDTAEDLGAVVATWGSFDPERSGVTSLDLARQAALSIATTAVSAGDRVSYHELAPHGRTVLPGTGTRHLARVRSAIAATGLSADTSRYRRTPHVPNGSLVFVLSTFFDGTAARMAEQWQASGHRVVAIDVLPDPDAHRLTPEQRLALRLVTIERANTAAGLRRVGVDVIAWAGDADAQLRAAARVRP